MNQIKMAFYGVPGSGHPSGSWDAVRIVKFFLQSIRNYSGIIIIVEIISYFLISITSKMANPNAPADQLAAQNGRTLLELMSGLDIYSDPSGPRKTGIICTIGKENILLYLYVNYGSKEQKR